MKTNKGFTLTELLAVIAVLAVIIGLSFVTFGSVRNNVLEAQYENVVSTIINDALEYGRDLNTAATVYVTVDTLVKSGYVTADDEDGYLRDPRDKTIMNCYIVEIRWIDEEYVAEIVQENHLENDKCEITDTNFQEMAIYCNGSACENKWYNSNVKLSLYVEDESLLEDSVIEWTNLLGNFYEAREIKTEVEKVMNTMYTAIIKKGDKIYSTTANIKIDLETPLILNKQINIDYGESQYLIVSASDMSGSGKLEYALSNQECSKLTDADYSTNNVYEMMSAGSYNICVRDLVKNTVSDTVVVNKLSYDLNYDTNPLGRIVDVYYLADKNVFNLLKTNRNGYTFGAWYDSSNRVVNKSAGLLNNEVLTGHWLFNDIFVNYEKIETTEIDPETAKPVNVVLVLDKSSAMGTEGLNQLKSTANDLIDKIDFVHGSTVSVVQFDATASILFSGLTSASDAKNAINGLASSGEPSLTSAVQVTNALLTSTYADQKDKTYVIFISNGLGGSVASTDAEALKASASKVYAIGIGSGAETSLSTVASDGGYHAVTDDLDEMYKEFLVINEEIVEKMTELSHEGLVELTGLVLDSTWPFVLNIKDMEYSFTSIASVMHLLSQDEHGNYYLNLIEVDEEYALDGDFSEVSFTYYYE